MTYCPACPAFRAHSALTRPRDGSSAVSEKAGPDSCAEVQDERVLVECYMLRLSSSLFSAGSGASRFRNKTRHGLAVKVPLASTPPVSSPRLFETELGVSCLVFSS